MKKVPISDKEVAYIKRAKAGEDRAFTWLFNKYQGLVSGILKGYLKDEDEARDMTNVVFLKVHEKLDKFSIYDSFGGWLRTLTNRVAIDYLRIKGNRRYTLMENDDCISGLEVNEAVEDESVNHYLAVDIFEILDRYKPHVRKIFEMHYAQGMPIEMISSKLRIPTGTIKSILSRTRNKIKKQLTNPKQ